MEEPDSQERLPGFPAGDDASVHPRNHVDETGESERPDILPTEACGAERLHKLLARAGVGSRRRCEDLIRAGRVRVDGVMISEMGLKANPGAKVEVDGATVDLSGLPGNPGAAICVNTGTDIDNNGGAAAGYIYILMNKPYGVISSARDQFGRKTVVDIVKDDVRGRIYPVGRLDYGTTGLLLLTNDGDFAYRATHPKFNVDKEYEVVCDRAPDDAGIARLSGGIVLDDGFRTAPAKVRRDAGNPRKLIIVIHEGKNRQVRRMIEAAGFSVRSLARVAVGGLRLGSLVPGEFRIIDRAEAELALIRTR